MKLTFYKQLSLTSSLLVVLLACSHQKKISPPNTKNAEVYYGKEQAVADNFLSEYLNLKYDKVPFQQYIYISIKHQQLYLIRNDTTIKKYPISTAINGVGNTANSNKTPWGLHTIKKKIGKDVPSGGILNSRVFYGQIAPTITNKKNAKKDYVTSRIMWLQGKDYGINSGEDVDSFLRYIYIHGTPEEGFIGQPASHGCIRMKNKDVIELFDFVTEGTPVFILEK